MKLGDKVRDKITGFTGIAIARCDYLYGCISIEVMSEKLLNGKPVSIWVDDVQLDVLSDKPEIKKTSKKKYEPKFYTRKGGMNRSLPPHRQPSEPWH